MQTEPYAGVMRLVRSVADAWKNARQKQVALDELTCCGHVEIDRIACDLNLTSAELKALAAQNPKSADLLYQRLAALGVDPGKIDKAVMRDLQRACSCCDRKAECAGDLEARSRAARWPSYCPNATTIATMTTCCH